MRHFLAILFSILYFSGCTTATRLNAKLIRPWMSELDQEAPSTGPYLAHHQSGRFELLYLAAHHDNRPNSDTHRLVEKLFRDFRFNFLIIEPIPHSTGESPPWFVEEATRAVQAPNITLGESSLSVVRASERRIPFAGGEIDDLELFKQLKAQAFHDEDILGFYLVRQIPQWVRESKSHVDLIENKGPKFISHYCKVFQIHSNQCPSLSVIQAWYQRKTQKQLGTNVDTEELAPVHKSPVFTHQISAAIGSIRDRFTLGIIESSLTRHQRVAVVYGSSHYLTLRKAIESGLGPAKEFILPPR